MYKRQGVLHGVVDLAHRGINGVYRDHTDDSLGRLVLVGGDIAAAVGQGQLHVQAGVGAQSGDVQVRVEDLHLAVRLDIAGRDLTLAVCLNVDRLDAFAVQLGNDALHVEDDLGHILLHTWNGGELMLDAGDLDGSHRRAWQRGEKDAAQRVAQRGAIASLQRLHYIFAIGIIAGVLNTFDAGLFDFYHMLYTLLFATACKHCLIQLTNSEGFLSELLRVQLDDEVLFHGEVDVVPCGHSNDFALEGIFRVVQPLGHIDLVFPCSIHCNCSIRIQFCKCI